MRIKLWSKAPIYFSHVDLVFTGPGVYVWWNLLCLGCSYVGYIYIYIDRTIHACGQTVCSLFLEILALA